MNFLVLGTKTFLYQLYIVVFFLVSFYPHKSTESILEILYYLSKRIKHSSKTTYFHYTIISSIDFYNFFYDIVIVCVT